MNTTTALRNRILYRWTTVALTFFVLVASVLSPRSAHAAPLVQEYTYGECSRADEAAVQSEMTTLAHGVLVKGSSGLQIDVLVADTWKAVEADATFNAAVDAGIARLQVEEDYWQRLWSGWSADKAAEFANRVAAYAFEDAALQAKLDELSTAIANSLVVELQSAAARSASSALLCLQSYVGEQYSDTLFQAFQNTVSQDVDTTLNLGQSEPVHISPLEMHAKGLTGVGIIVATQITRRIATALAEKLTARLAGRIAGRVLGRLGSTVIPYAGWAVGIGLLVWDLWEGSQGSLPAIREALQAEEVKAEVRAEIAAAVSEGVTAEIETLAASMATTLVTQWQEFCSGNGDVCTLAQENDSFRALLDAMPIDQLGRLVYLTGFFWSTFGAEAGEQKLNAALDDGSFAKLLSAPSEADLILQVSASPAATLAWVALAGDQLAKVVQLELYETIDPLRMTQLSLATLLEIDDNAIIHKLRLLPIDTLLTLLQLSSADLTQIAATATSDELGWFANYLATLSPTEMASVSQDLAKGAVTIALLQVPPVAASEQEVEATAPDEGSDESRGEVSMTNGMFAKPKAQPLATIPQAVVELWMPWASNGVIVSAIFIVLLLIVVGIVLVLRRQIIDPPL